MALEEQIESCQLEVENQALQLIAEKEKELQEQIIQLQENMNQALVSSQKLWFENAEQELIILLGLQAKKFNAITHDISNSLKTKLESTIRNKLNRMNQSNTLINFLVDELHTEINDAEKSLNVVQSHNEQGVVLTIENDDSIVRISTTELLSELSKSIENTIHD